MGENWWVRWSVLGKGGVGGDSWLGVRCVETCGVVLLYRKSRRVGLGYNWDG